MVKKIIITACIFIAAAAGGGGCTAEEIDAEVLTIIDGTIDNFDILTYNAAYNEGTLDASVEIVGATSFGLVFTGDSNTYSNSLDGSSVVYDYTSNSLSTSAIGAYNIAETEFSSRYSSVATYDRAADQDYSTVVIGGTAGQSVGIVNLAYNRGNVDSSVSITGTSSEVTTADGTTSSCYSANSFDNLHITTSAIGAYNSSKTTITIGE
ncbi:hypothetical protein [Desulforhopalus singaporensis]|uniref:Uncharacterized protein n=1 Tax=Desulforhopalus singaporensis TaxID=91360 RepID=A0A1H0VIZ7_9BACT|nr:hypothetical protein [Desulforhopalus singaporensis]SDP78559.1 hypothetical protein SAMN05660330_04102 [Desulforhopalus singaporensis]